MDVNKKATVNIDDGNILIIVNDSRWKIAEGYIPNDNYELKTYVQPYKQEKPWQAK